MDIANRAQDEIFSEFIINQLEAYSYDIDSLIKYIFRYDGLLEQLRVGINQYYGRNEVEKKLDEIEFDSTNFNQGIVEISLRLPKKLIEFINDFCDKSMVSKEAFLSFLIMERFESIYSEPEVLLGYINKESGFFKALREGVNNYRNGVN